MRTLLPVLLLLFAACDETTTKDVATETDEPELELEGDDAGECSDGADNDQDGLFDCDDPGCDGSPDCETTSLPTYDTGYTSGCTETYSGPVLVQDVSVSCSGSDSVRYYARTDGWTSSGIVNAMDTANSSPWDDEHDLISFDYDDCGFEDNLERVLSAGAAINTWVPNQSTLFNCDDHFADTGVMTYSARVYDLDNNFADCLAWGHDPQGFANGDYWSSCVNCPTAQSEISTCVVARSAL